MITLGLILFCVSAILGTPVGLNRIVGGEDAKQGQIPGMVSLRMGGSHFCGGSILTDYVILTGASCLLGLSASDITVVAGSNLLSSGGVSSSVELFVTHEEFNSQTLENDIGLMRLSSQLTFGPDIQPISVTVVDPGDLVTVYGWGINSNSGELPDNLQWVNGTSIDNSECSLALNNSIGPGNVCVGGVTGKGICIGDSGSPLVRNVTDYGEVQVGIVSWGVPCGVGYPDVFTRVSYYVGWILGQRKAWEDEDNHAA